MVAPGGSRLPGPLGPGGPPMVMSCGGGPPSSACSPIIPLLASFTSEESDGKRCFTGTQNSARLSYPFGSFRFHRTGHLNLFFFDSLLFSSTLRRIVYVVQPVRSQLPVLLLSLLLLSAHHNSNSKNREVNKKGTISRNRAQLNWFKGLDASRGHFVTAYTPSLGVG